MKFILVDLFGPLEEFLVLMLSEVSSKRMRYECAKTWEAKFLPHHDKLSISDELWKLLEPFYLEGKWRLPVQRTAQIAKSKPSDKPPTHRSVATTPLREKNSSTIRNSTRKNATPQRFNRQLAALSGNKRGTPTRGTPTRLATPNSRKKIISSTFANKDDTADDFVTIDSPISFSGRRLTENQKEKLREKRKEEHVGTNLYSNVDDSQSSRSMSQFLGSDTQVYK